MPINGRAIVVDQRKLELLKTWKYPLVTYYHFQASFGKEIILNRSLLEVVAMPLGFRVFSRKGSK